jgi:hypothetical protein
MEAYRVRKVFQWDGWAYSPKGPNGECKCGCVEGKGSKCTGVVGTSCVCHDTSCHCACGIREEQYAGDVFIVSDGHPRKEHMLKYHFATYDGGLPSIDELLSQDEYKRLLKPYQPREEKRVGRPKVSA